MDWFVKAFIKTSLVWLTLGVTLGVAIGEGFAGWVALPLRGAAARASADSEPNQKHAGEEAHLLSLGGDEMQGYILTAILAPRRFCRLSRGPAALYGAAAP